MPTILLVGTADTKAAELAFLQDRIRESGCEPLLMDVGVLGEPPIAVDISRHEVADASGAGLLAIASSGDENTAMTAMARGASRLASSLHSQGSVHAALILGGSMGTDLALDVAQALPLGVPKLVLSTVAFSPMIPPHRVPPDVTMILWAGGLFGLNSVCRSTLAQAAGAVCGAVRAARPPGDGVARIGITSFGSACLKYMSRLVPALEKRGFEAAVFHATGMGGLAFEALAASGRFAAVMDFALQEVTNHYFQSPISAGPGRLLSAGRAGVPQLVAPGAIDLIDFPGWQPPPIALAGRPAHAHNRLLASTSTTAPERRAIAREVAAKLRSATGPVAFLLPLHGLHEWDRPGSPLHSAEGLLATIEAFRDHVLPPCHLVEVDAHINDPAFTDAALVQFDAWRDGGLISRQVPEAPCRLPQG